MVEKVNGNPTTKPYTFYIKGKVESLFHRQVRGFGKSAYAGARILQTLSHL